MEQKEWQNLSKGERRRLRREEKRARKLKEQRKKNFLKWAKIAVLLVVVACGFLLFKYFKAKRYANAPKIAVTPKAYDFGKVQASEGKVETTFKVKNAGSANLTLTGMETSCGCTKAKLKIKDQKSNIVESPEFGMHDNPTDWSANLEPDKEAELIVIFDPNYHQDTFGPVTRTISIFSSDPGKKEEKIYLYANIYR